MKSGNFYVIKFSKKSLKDKIKLKNSGLDNKCKDLLILMKENPFFSPPEFKKLRGDLNGLYSRRINRQHSIE